MRWHYRNAQLAWLFPLAFALHIAEEWFFGFPEWIGLMLGAALPRLAFVVINAVAWVAMALATAAAVRREENGWMEIAIATILFINAIAHVAGSLVTRTYSPGLFTSVVLYFPLGQLALMRAWDQAADGLFAKGAATGVALHALVFVIAYAAAMNG